MQFQEHIGRCWKTWLLALILKEESQAVLQRDACVTSALEGSMRAKLFEVPRGSPTSGRSMISLD